MKKFDFTDNSQKSKEIQLNEILNFFDDLEKKDDMRIANLILFEVPQNEQDFNKNHTKANHTQDKYIIGGFASHAWGSSYELKEIGNESCFLFNLTLNLRFNAIPSRGPYQIVDIASDSSLKRKIMFGQ